MRGWRAIRGGRTILLISTRTRMTGVSGASIYHYLIGATQGLYGDMRLHSSFPGAFESAPVPQSAVGLGFGNTPHQNGFGSASNQGMPDSRSHSHYVCYLTQNISSSQAADNPWATLDSTATGDVDPDPWNYPQQPVPTYPSLSTQSRKLGVPASTPTKSRAASVTSNSSSNRRSISSPPPPEVDDAQKTQKGVAGSVSAPSAPNLAGMSKEEKAAEMARRKEERKQVRVSFHHSIF